VNSIRSIYPVDPGAHTGNYISGFVRSVLMNNNFDSGRRHAMGWRGLRPVSGEKEGWTCRIRDKNGVYGFFLREEKAINCYAKFGLCYFPEPEEEIIEKYSIQAAFYSQLPDYTNLIRNFTLYPEFFIWYEIGDIIIQLNKDSELSLIKLISPERKQISYTDELITWISVSSSPQRWTDGLNQDLPAFNLAFPLFDLFVSSFVLTLDCPIRSLNQWKSGINIHLEMYFEEKKEAENKSESIYSWNILSETATPFPDAKWWGPLKEKKENSCIKKEVRINIPELIVLTGFLGSGKTTFLKRFIEYHVSYNSFVAVIQNEIGELGLDVNLLEDDFAVLEIDEGCVCCSLVGQLKKGILKILEDHHPDFIILETTGLANPYNLLNELDEISDLIRFSSVTTVIDGDNFIRSAACSEIAIEQLRAADHVILNKTDLLTTARLIDVQKRIKQINPGVTILPCRFGDVNPSLLTGHIRKINIDLHQEKHYNHIDEGISSRKCVIKRKLNKQFLISKMNMLPETIIRVKGVVDIEGQSSPFIVQYVNGSCVLEEMNHHVPKSRFLIYIGKSETLNQSSIFIN